MTDDSDNPVPDLPNPLVRADSEHTRRTYENGWRVFTEWCEETSRTAWPTEPSVLADWIDDQAEAGLAMSTVWQRVCAVSHINENAGFRKLVKDYGVMDARERAAKSLKQKKRKAAPITRKILTQMVATCDQDTAGLRDRALLTLGWHAGLKRSELTALTVEDMRLLPNGVLRLQVEGRPEPIELHPDPDPDICPVRAWKAWMEGAGLFAGPLFKRVDRWGKTREGGLDDASVNLVIKRHIFAMDGRTVARHIKARASEVGLDPSRFSGESLKRGYERERERIERENERAGRLKRARKVEKEADTDLGKMLDGVRLAARRAHAAGLMVAYNHLTDAEEAIKRAMLGLT